MGGLAELAVVCRQFAASDLRSPTILHSTPPLASRLVPSTFLTFLRPPISDLQLTQPSSLPSVAAANSRCLPWGYLRFRPPGRTPAQPFLIIHIWLWPVSVFNSGSGLRFPPYPFSPVNPLFGNFVTSAKVGCREGIYGRFLMSLCCSPASISIFASASCGSSWRFLALPRALPHRRGRRSMASISGRK